MPARRETYESEHTMAMTKPVQIGKNRIPNDGCRKKSEARNPKPETRPRSEHMPALSPAPGIAVRGCSSLRFRISLVFLSAGRSTQALMLQSSNQKIIGNRGFDGIIR